MEHIRKRLQIMMDLFFKITTGVIFVTAVYIRVFWGVGTVLDVGILWEILTVSGLCALGSVVLPCGVGKEVSKRELIVRATLYFGIVNVVVLGCGFWFEWFYFSSWKMVLGMECGVVGVYVVVTALNYFVGVWEAEEMNRRLKERGE